MIFLNIDDAVNLGKRIETLRNQLGMSQSELAKRVKTTQNTIHKIESGETKRSGFIPVIAEQLGCTTEELLGSGEVHKTELSPMREKLIRKIKDADQQDLTEIEDAINAVLKIANLKRNAEGD